MANSTLKMSYIPAQYRVRVEFTKTDTSSAETPPDDLIVRAKKKLESEQAKEKISFFVLYESTLKDTWARMKASDEAPDAMVAVTLGCGVPLMRGLIVEKSPKNDALALLTIQAPKSEVANWKYKYVELAVKRKLDELDITFGVDTASIQSLLMAAKRGEVIKRKPILGINLAPNDEILYEIKYNDSYKGIILIIYEIKEMFDDNMISSILIDIIQESKKITAARRVQFELLKKEIVLTLRSANRGPEHFGLNLPMILLAAVNKPHRAGAPRGVKRVHAPPTVKTNKNLKFPPPNIGIEIADDKMSAIISSFSADEIYDAYADADTSFWRDFLETKGIVVGTGDEYLGELVERIRTKSDLEDLKIAAGKNPVPGRLPYLHHTYKHKKIDDSNEEADLRDMQQRAVVEEGQVVAEIRYKKEPLPGKDIFGREVLPPPGEELTITAGDGIEIEDGVKFIATFGGVPHIDKNHISIQKNLIYAGNVNLSSGNLYFDGPVEIKGSIQQGTTVDVTGDLLIHGLIEGGFVTCGGTITVKGGIVGRGATIVKARGNVYAEFIENSRVMSSQNVEVVKSIISGDVTAGESIVVRSKEGLIAAGLVSCWNCLVCGNLGRREGTVTRVNTGASAKWERAYEIRRIRIEKLKETNKEDRKTLRTLARKTNAQMTKKHKEMKEKILKRVQRCASLIGKMEDHMQSAKDKVVYNKEARILVNGILSRNVDVSVGGQKIHIEGEVSSAAVVAKRVRGEHIIPIEKIGDDDDIRKIAG